MSQRSHGSPWGRDARGPVVREPFAQPRHRCRACSDVDDTAAPGKLPAGWYQLKIVGAFDERDAQPGSYCSSECLAVAVSTPTACRSATSGCGYAAS
jgi:hypothetical protein